MRPHVLFKVITARKRFAALRNLTIKWLLPSMNAVVPLEVFLPLKALIALVALVAVVFFAVYLRKPTKLAAVLVAVPATVLVALRFADLRSACAYRCWRCEYKLGSGRA